MYMWHTCTHTHTNTHTHTHTHSHTVTQYEDINLQELCLDKLFSCLKSSKEVDSLPLPGRLKDKLKEYFSL